MREFLIMWLIAFNASLNCAAFDENITDNSEIMEHRLQNMTSEASEVSTLASEEDAVMTRNRSKVIDYRDDTSREFLKRSVEGDTGGYVTEMRSSEKRSPSSNATSIIDTSESQRKRGLSKRVPREFSTSSVLTPSPYEHNRDDKDSEATMPHNQDDTIVENSVYPGQNRLKQVRRGGRGTKAASVDAGRASMLGTLLLISVFVNFILLLSLIASCAFIRAPRGPFVHDLNYQRPVPMLH